MAHNLTAFNTPAYVTGTFGQALNAASGYLYTQDNLTTAAFTVEAWVKTASTTTQVFFSNDSTSLWFGSQGGNLTINAGSAGTIVNGTGSRALTDGAWHHVAFTYDGTNLALFQDGIRFQSITATAAVSLNPGAGKLSVGSFGANSFNWSGAVDEFRVSSTIRYSGATYTAPVAAFTGDASTTALWHLDGDGIDSAAAGGGADTTAPTVPTGLTATPGSAQVGLSWTASTDAVGVTGYKVYRGGTLVGSPTGTSYTDTGLTNGTTYSYTVSAVDAAANESAQTSAVTATPTAGTTVPGAPTGLTATAGSGQVALSWTAPASTGGAAITDYLVEVQPAGGSFTTFADGTSTATTATVTGLTNGTAYSFRVSAINSVGTGTASSTATATPVAAAGTIAANDANIVYSPYTWDVTAVRAKTINSGAYFSALIAGTATAITANFDVSGISSPAPQLAYRVDGGPWTVVTVAATISIPIPATNTGTKHFVEVRVKSTPEAASRWTPQSTAVIFTGFTVAPNTVTTGTVRKRRFSILCFGDSITEGVRTLGQSQPVETDRNDASMAWAYPLGQLLGAEVGVVGFGATGWNGAGSGGVPALPSSYNLLWSGTSRVFTPAPDLVLVHLGTNDSGDVTTAATGFLNGILALSGTTKIAVILPWNGGHAAQLQAAITASTAPSRVTYVDTTGWWNPADASDGLHPYGYTNLADLAPRLAATVGPLLTGSGTAVTPKRFVNVGGTAKAIA